MASRKRSPAKNEAGDSQKISRINLGVWETVHLPSPKLTLTLTSHFGQNDGLGEGWVGSFPET